MTRMQIALLSALLWPVFGCGGEASDRAPSGADRGPHITAESLDDALVRAKEADRNILVVYGSKDCPYSREMESQTLADEKVKDALRDFVVVRLQKGVNAKEFEKEWGPLPTPTVVTLDADGEALGKMLKGVVSPSDFLAYASWASGGGGFQPDVRTGGG